MSKQEDINKLIIEIKNCKKCKLCENRLKTVPGTGDINSLLMICGEGPGQAESEQGIPFCGRSGKLLTTIIKKELGLNREDVYITNIVKCRPPNNRDPLPDEVKNCIPYLKQQIKIIQPKVLVTLGAVALKSLFRDPSLAIGRNRGIWRAFEGIQVLPTYHPSFLLRQMSESNKNKVKSDLKLVKDKLADNEENNYESDSFYDKFFEGL